MKPFYLFVDDERKFNYSLYENNYTPIVCRSYFSTIYLIEELAENNCSFIIDLDHDLGEEKTGYDICKYIVENEISVAGFIVHSMNPVGANNIRQLMRHYGYKEIV